MNTPKNVVGIYHKDCIDGTTAAAVMLREVPNIHFHPLKHEYTKTDIENLARSLTKDTTVYIVDFSLREGHNEILLEHVGEVITIDHHIGVHERLKDVSEKHKNFSYVFDNDHSGASLTWLYFRKDEPMPLLIQYVEDNDLHKGQMGNKTWYVATFLSQYVNNPHQVKVYVENKEMLEHALSQGRVLSEYNEFLVKASLKSTEPIRIKIKDRLIYAYNTPEPLRSQIGHIAAQEKKQAVSLFVFTGEMVRLHFRSSDEHTPSALELAQALGGNGHRNAAGARVTLKDFLKMIQV